MQPVRGTHDLLGEDMRRHRRVSDGAREIAGLQSAGALGPRA